AAAAGRLKIAHENRSVGPAAPGGLPRQIHRGVDHRLVQHTPTGRERYLLQEWAKVLAGGESSHETNIAGWGPTIRSGRRGLDRAPSPAAQSALCLPSGCCSRPPVGTR